MIRLLGRKLKSVWGVPLFTKLWLFPAWVLLGLSRIAVLLVPFRTIAVWLGQEVGTASVIPLLTPNQRTRAVLVGRTVRMAARYAPWQANCFAQAITASLLLRLYHVPYTVFFGLKRGELLGRPLDAHAWTATGGVAVTGGYGFDAFTVVGVFRNITFAIK